MTSSLIPNTADALLFDIGRVVLDIDFNRALHRWAGHAGCAPAAIAARYRQDAFYKQHEIAAIDTAAYFQSLRGSLGIDITDAQFLEGWNAIFIGEMPDIAQLLARAATRVPLYAFSNTNIAHTDCFVKSFAGVLGHFRELFLSSSIGLRKPDAEAYRYVIDRIGVAAGRIVFFDDLRENIKAASACGLQTVHVTSPTSVAEALQALGL